MGSHQVDQDPGRDLHPAIKHVKPDIQIGQFSGVEVEFTADVAFDQCERVAVDIEQPGGPATEHEYQPADVGRSRWTQVGSVGCCLRVGRGHDWLAVGCCGPE